MKILEINKFYFSKGGADKHFLDLVELLKSKGRQVAVFSMRHPRNLTSQWEKYFVSMVGYTSEYSLWQKIKGIPRMFYSFEARKKINKLLNDFRPDIVHVHNIYHQLSPAILFEIKKRKIPVIMTIHDYKIINPNYNLYHNGEFYNRCKNGKYYQCFLDKCVKNSYFKSFIAMLEAYWQKFLGTYEKNIDLYLVPSQFVKNKLVEWGIDGEKIRVLPHFIPDKNIENDNIAILQRAVMENRKSSRPYFLYFGRISKYKGLDDLINIFSEIKNVDLYIAGSVEDSYKIPESQNIKYLGHLNQNQLKPFIKNSMAIVSGSKLPETFGLIALEAIAQGKPFISFCAGAFPEIIENGVNGYLAENNIGLKRKIAGIAEGKIFFDGKEIRRSAIEKYGSEKYAEKLMGIFQELRHVIRK